MVEQIEPMEVVEQVEPSVLQEETWNGKDRTPIYTQRTVATRKKKDFNKYRRQTQQKLNELQQRLTSAGDDTKLASSLKNQISSYSSRLRQKA